MLTPAELERYNRQLLLPELGIAGQERLRAARLLVVGGGGLGSPALLYLAAAGVGTLGIVDGDRVDASNLHRQVIHGTGDIGREKSASAAAALHRLNPHVTVNVHQERIDFARMRALVADYELVVDGCDNYSTRYAINDACAAAGIPWIYGSVERFSGQVSVFGVAGGPCYRCLFPEAPRPESTASCDEVGVLGAVPGVVGSMQAVEALKLLTGIGEPLVGRLLQFDFRAGTTKLVRFDKQKNCVACGNSVASDKDQQTPMLPPFDVEPQEVVSRMGKKPSLVLLDIREPWEAVRASIAHAERVPMDSLENNLGSIDRTAEFVVFCHHGGRSRVATEWLRSLGYQARNLVGGIDRWSREIDPGVPRY